MPSTPAANSASATTAPLDRPAHKPVIYLLLAIVLLGAALRAIYFNPDLTRTPDERTYTRQANMVLNQGVDGFRILGQELAQDPAAVSCYPSPLRVGYIGLLAFTMRLTGDTTVLAGTYLSFLCSLAALCLIAMAGYRYLSDTVAVVATLFYAVLPLDLTTYRRTWEESLIALLTIAMLALAAYIARTSSPRRWIALGGLASVGLFAFSVKETAGLAFMFCAAGLVLHLLLRRDRRAALATVACVAAVVLIYLAVLGSIFGGVAHSLLLMREYMHYSGIAPYSLQTSSVPARFFPEALFRISPLLCIAGLCGLSAALYRIFRARSLTYAGLPFGISILTVILLLIQGATHRYNLRYSAPIYGPLCLFAGTGVDAILRATLRLRAPLGRITAWILLGSALSVSALRDFNFARDHLLLPDAQNLALQYVLPLPPAPAPAASGIASMEAAVKATSSIQDRINFSLAYINGNAPGSAVPVLQSVVADDPNNLIAWNNLCVAHTLLQEYKPALEECGRAVQIDPAYPLSRNNLKWTQDENDKALRALAAMEQGAPSTRDAKFFMDEGLQFLHTGSYDQAIRSWQRTLDLEPRNAIAANNIGTAYMFKKQPRTALQWFQRALSMDPALQLAKNNAAWANDEIAKLK